ncbi:MAG: preprotein translocase subunit SecE [Clostridia bacterium]
MTENKVEKKKKGGGISKWFREMKSELNKVVWPTWAQVVKNTGIVITMVIIVAVFIGIADFALHAGVGALTDIFPKG